MLYINNVPYNFFFIGLITLFLLIDLGQFFLIGTVVVPLLLCLYCVLILRNPRYIPLIIIAFLQCLESFCFYNFFLLAGVYILPISILALLFKKNLYPSYAHIIAVALIGITLQIYAIDGFFLDIWQTNHYTIMRIGGTLLMTICFSLTINIWGMQGNRA